MPGVFPSAGPIDIADYIRNLERRLARLERGSFGSPSSDSAVITSLNIVGLSLSTQTTIASNDYYKVMMRYSWTDVANDPSEYNKDALDGYLVSWSLNGTNYTPEQFTKTNAIDVGPFDQGQVVTFRVRARTIKGTYGNFASITNSSTTDATAPFQPSTPVVTPYLGQLAVDWNGLDVSSNQPPTDFRFMEVHASVTSATFTPSVGTLMGTILRGGGTWVLTDLTYGTTYYIRLVAVDTVGNRSPASTGVAAVPEQVVNADVGANAIATANIQNLAVNDAKIGSMSVGKLTAGTLTSNLTIGARIMTASTGARVEMNATGLQAYNTAGSKTVDIAAATGAATFVGTFQTDFSTSANPHLEMRNFGDRSAIYFRDNSGTSVLGSYASILGYDNGITKPALYFETAQFPYAGVTSAHSLFLDTGSGIYLRTLTATTGSIIGYNLSMDSAELNIYRNTPTGIQSGGTIYGDAFQISIEGWNTGTMNGHLSITRDGQAFLTGSFPVSNAQSGAAAIYAGSWTVNANAIGTWTYGATMAGNLLLNLSCFKATTAAYNLHLYDGNTVQFRIWGDNSSATFTWWGYRVT